MSQNWWLFVSRNRSVSELLQTNGNQSDNRDILL